MSEFFGRLVVVSLLCLTTFAASAFAEGAWVLWSQSLSINVDDLTKSEVKPLSWDPIDASATEAGCRSKMKEKIEKARQMYVGQYGNATNFSAEEDFYSATIPSLRTRVLDRLLCLPDTIDPRGLKGK